MMMRRPTLQAKGYSGRFKVKYDLVSLSDASIRQLDSPTMSPPQPPVTQVQYESPTGNVMLAKIVSLPPDSSMRTS